MELAHLLSPTSFIAPSAMRSPNISLTSVNIAAIRSSSRAFFQEHAAARLGSRLGVATCTMEARDEAREEPNPGRKPPTQARLVDIIRYPVKSCRGEQLSDAVVTAEGLEGDRRFLVTAADGRYQTQRELPALATVEARVLGDSLQLRHATSSDARPINVTIRRAASPSASANLFGTPLKLTDQGPEAASWLSEAVVGGGTPTNPLAKLQGALFGPPLKLLRAPDPVPGSPTPLRGGAGLADLSPLLLVCEESLAALNARRVAEGGKPPATMDRFRPNLVLRGCGPAHAEDAWSRIRIGSAEFRVTGPCPRCGVPDVAQSTGVRDAAAVGPMATLKAYRARPGAGVLFGIYVTPILGGGGAPGTRVRVGDEVEAV